MKKGLKKLRFIICLIMCLCISIATFQVGVFADETTTQASAEVVNVDDVQADVQTNNTLEMKFVVTIQKGESQWLKIRAI